MGDIHCKVCGEPWDSYGVHHHEDMDAREANMLLSGRGCPSCKGKPVVDCGIMAEEHYLFSSYAYMETKWCPHFDYAGHCNAEKCIKSKDYRRPRKPISGIEFATSVVENDDEDPLEAIAKMDKSVWKE